ncbi:gp53-like domain-containing protein [Photorhabdus africana]|uniref:gp53-like domain-containing protein n=1 Tax=Photorhabdus africana TaxID=3097554 RepID=UPI002B40AD13|nr:hypothetical protein [Photorhabdus sp. CRI-LC]
MDATGSISGRGVYEYPSIRVYSAVNKPSPGELGAYTTAEVDSRINSKGAKNTASKASNGWWQCGDTGIIYQWMYVKGNPNGSPGGGRGDTFNFPKEFPNVCFNVSLTTINRKSTETTATAQLNSLPTKTGFTTHYGSREHEFLVIAIGF